MVNDQQPIIRLDNVSYAYPGGALVLDGLDLVLQRGDRLGLAAPNGSGKTTLFHLIMGLIRPTAGRIEIFGQPRCRESDFVEVRRRIGMLFQDSDDQLFSPTVIEDVAFGPLNQGYSREQALAASRSTLDFLGLSDFEERITFKLSGGEKRLVALATVLAMKPETLLLDEPTAGLDDRTKRRLIEILGRLEMTSIVISHEYDFLSATAHRIFTMEGGRILLDEELRLHHHQHAHRVGGVPHRHV
jgi:cobalt/nickel transport system ATP-binding protein